MQATAIMCDYAQVNSGKLYLIGAGVSLAVAASAAPPHTISLAAGILITIPWNAHNQLHRLKISLIGEDGANVRIAAPQPGQSVAEEDVGSILAQFNAGRSAMMQPGEESIMPIAVPLNIEVPSLGAYTVVVELDGTRAAQARFRVVHAAQLPGATAV